MKRQRAHRQRQQAEVSRAAAESERKLTGWLPDPGPLAERGKVLRRRVLASMRALASNEEEAARIFQDLAASNPNRRAEYLDQAEHARTSALSAREVLARFSA